MAATKNQSTSGYLLLVLAVALGALVPLYWIDDARSLRPSRVLGPLGLPGAPAADLPVLAEPSSEAPPVALRPDANPTRQPGAAPSAAPAPATQGADRSLPPAGTPPVTRPEQPPAAGVASAQPASSAPAAAVRSGTLLPIEGVEHLRSFYSALARSERNAPIRVLHYGDSTLAGDGIAKTVRLRLKTQFGDGGPGFVVAGMDPRWMRRDDVRVNRSGEWDIYTILHGGNQGRYGLGGIVAKPRTAGQVQVTPARSGQALGQRLEIFAQKARRPEPLRLQINGTAVTANTAGRIRSTRSLSLSPGFKAKKSATATRITGITTRKTPTGIRCATSAPRPPPTAEITAIPNCSRNRTCPARA